MSLQRRAVSSIPEVPQNPAREDLFKNQQETESDDLFKNQQETESDDLFKNQQETESERARCR